MTLSECANKVLRKKLLLLNVEWKTGDHTYKTTNKKIVINTKMLFRHYISIGGKHVAFDQFSIEICLSNGIYTYKLYLEHFISQFLR